MRPRQQVATETNVADGEAPRSGEADLSLENAFLSDAETAYWSTAYYKFWVTAWRGTAVAGGLFAVFLTGWPLPEGFYGFVQIIVTFLVGASYAGVLAIPLHVTAAVTTWALWLPRFSCTIATIAGAATGVLVTAVIASFGGGVLLVAGAGLFGGLGTLVSVRRYQTRTHDGQWLRVMSRTRPWRFSLSTMLVHVAVLAVLFACWAWVINTLLDSGAVLQMR